MSTLVVTGALQFNQRLDFDVWDGSGIRCLHVPDDAPVYACLKGL